MEKIRKFNRCVYCFEEKENDEAGCLACGYQNEFCALPGWWPAPGTILKGNYVVGKPLEESKTELTYLGWDLKKAYLVEITEYFPKELVKRDITVSARVSCIPGKEEALERGRQEFFEKAKLFYQCVSRVEPLEMDFFFRNETCYYIRKKESEGRQKQKLHSKRESMWDKELARARGKRFERAGGRQSREDNDNPADHGICQA